MGKVAIVEEHDSNCAPTTVLPTLSTQAGGRERKHKNLKEGREIDAVLKDQDDTFYSTSPSHIGHIFLR